MVHDSKFKDKFHTECAELMSSRKVQFATHICQQLTKFTGFTLDQCSATTLYQIACLRFAGLVCIDVLCEYSETLENVMPLEGIKLYIIILNH